MKQVIVMLGVTMLIGVTSSAYAQTTSTSSKGNIYQQAAEKLRNGDYAGAVEAYNQVLLFDSNDTDAYVNRGIARFQTGDKRGALEDFNQAIRLNPNNVEAYNQRGGVYLTMGQKRKAKSDFQKAAGILRNLRTGTDPTAQPPNPDAPRQ